MKKLFVKDDIKVFVTYLLASVAGGYVIAHFLIPFIPVNTDSYAPIQQAQLLIEGGPTNLFNIHLARIPSLFPDLMILAGIEILFPIRGGLDLLSLYAWIYSSLFLLFSSYLIKEATEPEKRTLLEPLSVSLITIGLIAISPSARQAFGHLITPVHHGGNILNTLITLILSLKIAKDQHNRSLLIPFLVIISMATASNKLFLFTGVIPSAYLLLTKKTTKWILGWMSMMIVLGWGVGAAFNAQCSPEIAVHFTKSLIIIKEYWINYLPTVFTSIFSIASLGLIRMSKSRKGMKIITINQDLEDALTLISISCLTFYLYIFLLSSGGEVTVRYALILFSFIPILISILIHVFTKSQKDYWFICLVGLLCTIVYRPGYISRKINSVKQRPIHEMMRFRHRDPESELNTTLRFLKAKNLQQATGLSDYWGTGMALESNTRLTMYAVHSSGAPDYWSMSPETLIKGIDPNEKMFYVVSKNINFIKNIKQNLGRPLEHWKLNTKSKTYKPQANNTYQAQEETQLLIYNNDTQLNNMINHAKLFQRNCDMKSAFHKVR